MLGPVEVALFENLYVAHHREARGLAVRLLSDPERAADAVHTAYLEILRYLLSGRRWYDPGDARAVVLRNTRWAALNIIRDAKRRAELTGTPQVEQAAGDDWARLEARSLCEQIVGTLRRQEQEAIRLHFVEALSYADAAARLGISVRAFEGQLYRALRSARRAARGMGVGPSVLALLPGAVRTFARRRVRFRSLPRMSGVAIVRGVALAALPLAAAGLVNLAPHLDGVPAMSAVAARGSGESIYGSVVVDMIAVPSGHRESLIALAHGAGCRCWLLFWSADGGTSWQRAPGPTSVPAQPRLDVAADAVDPRVFIEDGSGHVALEAATLGAPFVPARQSLPAVAHVRHLTEGGQLSATVSGGELNVDGRGPLCSTDRGASWQRGCPPRP